MSEPIYDKDAKSFNAPLHKHLENLLKISILIRDGKGDDEQARDAIDSELDATWWKLGDDEQAVVRTVSAMLYREKV